MRKRSAIDPVLACSAAWLVAAAICSCDNGAPSEEPVEVGPEVVECPPGLAQDGECLAAPRPTPPELCPSARYHESGICLAAPPRLDAWTCPEGWLEEVTWEPRLADRDLGLEAVSACTPPAPPDTCAPGFSPRVGSTECVRVGVECPAGAERWSSDADLRSRAPGSSGVLLFVDAAASAAGEGSRQAPFPSIGEALGHAEAGDVIAVGPGDYAETVVLPAGVAIVGACAERTRLVVPGAAQGPALDLTSSGEVQVSDLTIEGGDVGVSLRAPTTTVRGLIVAAYGEAGIQVLEGSGTATLEDVLLVGPSDGSAPEVGTGLAVYGGTVSATRLTSLDAVLYGVDATGPGAVVSLEDVLVAHSRGLEVIEGVGAGLRVTDGAAVTVERGLLADNGVYGIEASGEGTEVRLADLVVADTGFVEVGTQSGLGNGLFLDAGAFARVGRALFEGNRTSALLVTFSTLEAVDVRVRDTLGTPHYSRGRGLAVVGGQATVQRSAFVQNMTSGVTVGQSDVSLSDVLIAETQSNAGGTTGFGMEIALGAQVDAERVALVRNHSQALNLHDEGTTATFRDVLVRETLARPADDFLGWGMDLDEGASAVLERASFLDNTMAGMTVRRPGTSLQLVDLVVSGTQPAVANGRFGRAAEVDLGATVRGERAAFVGNYDVGIYIRAAGTDVELSDLLVDTTQPSADNDLRGSGIEVLEGARLQLTRTELRGNHGVGILVTDPESGVALSGLLVRDTLPDSAGGGIGLTLRDGGDAIIQDFFVTASRLAGIQVAPDSAIMAENGLVSGNLIGVNIQNEGLSLADAFTNVRVTDNERDLDISELPVPTASERLPDL